MLNVICQINKIGELESNTIQWLSKLRHSMKNCNIIIGTGNKIDSNQVLDLRQHFMVVENCPSFAHLLRKEQFICADDYILPVFPGEYFDADELLSAVDLLQDDIGCAIINGKQLASSQINLTEHPEELATLDGFCIIKYSAIPQKWIAYLHNDYPDETRLMLLAALSIENPCIRVIRIPSNIKTKKGSPETPAWYSESYFLRSEALGNYFEETNGSVPYYIQYALGYQLLRRFRANLGKRCSCKKMCNDIHRDAFFRACSRILKYVDNCVLMRLDGTEIMRCPEPLIAFLFHLKLGQVDSDISFSPLLAEDDIYCCLAGGIITSVLKKRVLFESISALGEESIEFKVSTNGIFETLGCKVQVLVNNQTIELDANEGRAVNVFGKAIFHRINYSFAIEKKVLEEGNNLSFYYTYRNKRYPLAIEEIKKNLGFHVIREQNSNEFRLADFGYTDTNIRRKTHTCKAQSIGFLNPIKAALANIFATPSLLVALSSEDSDIPLETRIASLTASKLYRKGKMVIAVFTNAPSQVNTPPVVTARNIRVLDQSILLDLSKLRKLIQDTKCDYVMWDSPAGHVTHGFYFDAVTYMSQNQRLILVPENVFEENFVPGSNEFVDLTLNPQLVPTDCRGAIYSTNIILDIDGITQNDWDDVFSVGYEDERLLAAFCLLTRKYPYVVRFAEHAFLLEVAVAENGAAYRSAMDENWYFPSVDNFFGSVASWHENDLPIMVQYILFYRLLFRLSFNENQHDTHVISPALLPQWKGAIGRVLQWIDDEVIIDLYRIPKFHTKPHIALWLLRLKYGDRFSSTVSYDKKNLFLNACGLKLLNSETQTVQIEVLDYDNDALVIECSTAGFFESHNIMPHAEIDGNQLVCENSYYFCHRKLFGENMWKRFTFRIRVPFAGLQESKLTFFYAVEGFKYPMKVTAKRFPAKLSDSVPGSYCRCGNYLLSFGKKRYCINIFPYSEAKHSDLEAKLQEACISKAPPENLENITYLMSLRNKYYASQEEFNGRNIWITFDKLYKAGDNGEYFMRKAKDQTDGVEIYYVMNKGYPDAEQLENEGIHPLYYMSEKHILYYLNSSIIATTHANIPTFSGVPSKDFKYLQDLLKAEIVCIQHGLAVQWMPHNLYAGYDNIKRFYCASDSEINNLSHHQYGYGPGTLRLTGLARYDGLVNQSKRQILISPTWRSYIAMPSVAGNTRPYSDTFKNTTYFKVFNGLIQNQKLAETAQRCGYRIVYLLHPTLSSQVDDYVPAPGIEVRSPIGESYEKMMTESDLMVTDFSGIQFDFAYMRKPIVYYHPPELPAGYDEGGFNYNEQGFGPICTEEASLVEALCGYMERDCRLDDFYAERQNQFFAYSDHNNCLRIYHDILAFDRKQHSAERECPCFGYNAVPVLKTRILNSAGKTRIYWDSCPYNTGYEILASVDQFGTYEVVEAVDDLRRNYLVPEQYQNYWFKVRALFCDGDIKGNFSLAVRSGVAADYSNSADWTPVEILCCIKDATKGIRIFWSGADHAAFWNLYCRVGDKTEHIVRLSNVCTWEYCHVGGDPKLNPYYSIEPVYRDSDGHLVTGEISNEMTMMPRCRERVCVNYFDKNGAHISWKAENGPGEFQLYRRHSDRGRYELVSTFELADEFSYIDSGAEPGLGRYLLRKKTETGWQVSATTKFCYPNIPEFPSKITVRKLPNGSVGLNWLKTKNATEWVIHRSNIKTSEVEVARIPGSSIGWIDCGRFTGTEQYRVEVCLDENGSRIILSSTVDSSMDSLEYTN